MTTKTLTAKELEKLFKPTNIKHLEDILLSLFRIQYPNTFKYSSYLLHYDTFFFGSSLILTTIVNDIIKTYTPTYTLKYIYDNKSGNTNMIDIKLKNKISKHLKLPYIKLLQLIHKDITGTTLQKYIEKQYKKINQENK